MDAIWLATRLEYAPKISIFNHATMKKVFIRLEDPIHAPAFPIVRQKGPATDKKTPGGIARIHSRSPPHIQVDLPIALCYTLQLVLLLDGVRVATSLSSVNELFSQALSNALDVSERGFAGTDGEEGDGLVDAA